MPPSKLTPAIGNDVFYSYPGQDPLSARITHVYSPGVVNLCVFNKDGSTVARTSVQFEEEPGPASTAWSWEMPKPAKK